MQIIAVKYLEDYKLKVVFSDKNEKTADFENFLNSAKNPMTKAFLDIKKFKKVNIDTGFLSWNNGEMEISGQSINNEF
jgi:hypothetical protein